MHTVNSMTNSDKVQKFLEELTKLSIKYDFELFTSVDEKTDIWEHSQGTMKGSYNYSPLSRGLWFNFHE